MHVLHKQIDLIVKQRKSTLPGQSAHMLTFTEFSKICRFDSVFVLKVSGFISMPVGEPLR